MRLVSSQDVDLVGFSAKGSGGGARPEMITGMRRWLLSLTMLLTGRRGGSLG